MVVWSDWDCAMLEMGAEAGKGGSVGIDLAVELSYAINDAVDSGIGEAFGMVGVGAARCCSGRCGG